MSLKRSVGFSICTDIVEKLVGEISRVSERPKVLLSQMQKLVAKLNYRRSRRQLWGK